MLCQRCGKAEADGRQARYCQPCRRRGRMPQYILTPEREQWLRDNYRGRSGELRAAAEHLGVAYRTVERWTQDLGIARMKEKSRRYWTPEEDAQLWRYAGTRTVKWIAWKLKRSRLAILNRIARLKLRARVSEGYTQQELMLCFGVANERLMQWHSRGWLDVQTQGTERQRDGWMVSDEAILRFIEEHPMDFDLARVNQYWFMDLILNGKLVRQALEGLKRDREAA